MPQHTSARASVAGPRLDTVMPRRKGRPAPWSLVLCLIALGAALLTPVVVHAGTSPRPPHPEPRLAARSRGADILAALGEQASAVAAHYGWKSEAFRALAKSDRSLWADDRGRLFFACEGLVAAGEPGAGDRGNSTRSVFPLEDTFRLHSRPGTSRVIYLDFDGHLTSGTIWNQFYPGYPVLATPPYDTDGNPAVFSPAELEAIQDIWQRVAEDFAMLEVDVTTEDPGVEALRKSGVTDTTYGVRVCIGGSSLDWYGASAGGVGYVGSFNWNSDTPCYVFKAQLLNGKVKYVAEAASHEVGHTLGLIHDGQTDGTVYYGGHGNWAPIMGVGYYRDITQWSRGEYPLANNFQDDLAVMLNYGVAPPSDDHGDYLPDATPLAGPTLSAAGVIETSADVDAFSFECGAGLVAITVSCAPAGANLHPLAALYDAAGVLLAVTNAPPPGVTLVAAVGAGRHFLLVDGAGTGGPATGYSDYSSLGPYLISGNVPEAGAARPPCAVASATPTAGQASLLVNFKGDASGDEDGIIVSYTWQLGDGTSSHEPNPSHVFATAGTYVAVLTVTDNAGLSASDSVSIHVAPAEPPVAVATADPATGVAPLAVSFSSAGSSSANGTITTCWWDFGDGETSAESNPAHLYLAAGSYTAVLTVTDDVGMSATASVTIAAAAPQPPVARITASTTNGVAPLAVNFSSSESSAAQGAIAARAWDFGDGWSCVRTETSHIYEVPGRYTVRLTVTDGRGLTATESVQITVSAPQPPSAHAAASASHGIAPLTVSFSSADSADADGAIVGWWWDFGDGTASTEPNPNHTYAAGDYTATLTVTDDSGLSASAMVAISVTPPQPPVARISATATSGPAPLTVDFSAAESYDPDGTILCHLWDFREGAWRVGVEATRTFATPGVHTVTLAVIDDSGLFATASVQITVLAPQPPVAKATATPAAGPAPLVVTFSSAGSADPDGAIVGYFWDFGDGTTSTAPNPIHTYTTPGTYTATLVVIDSQGLTATARVGVNVAAPPKPMFVANIALSLIPSSLGNRCGVVVTVHDVGGAAVRGATVQGRWSGLVTRTVSGTTDAKGNFTFFTSPTMARGVFTFTVTNLFAAGYSYDPTRNTETGDSISTP